MKVEEELDVDAFMDARDDSPDAAERLHQHNVAAEAASLKPPSNGDAGDPPAGQQPAAALDLKPQGSGPRSGMTRLRICVCVHVIAGRAKAGHQNQREQSQSWPHCRLVGQQGVLVRDTLGCVHLVMPASHCCRHPLRQQGVCMCCQRTHRRSSRD